MNIFGFPQHAECRLLASPGWQVAQDGVCLRCWSRQLPTTFLWQQPWPKTFRTSKNCQWTSIWWCIGGCQIQLSWGHGLVTCRLNLVMLSWSQMLIEMCALRTVWCSSRGQGVQGHTKASQIPRWQICYWSLLSFSPRSIVFKVRKFRRSPKKNQKKTEWILVGKDTISSTSRCMTFIDIPLLIPANEKNVAKWTSRWCDAMHSFSKSHGFLSKKT